uniref:Uncharacterized protein n=1 Tax=Trichobilharzia regenti TaxID=157069 RepID=A0AA85IXF6_TRIRE|nr:unnamed protein product [Trichobilharzia regenti]
MLFRVEVNEWIRLNSWVRIILIVLGCVPILILMLVKALGYGREIDHYLIGFSYILLSMGFATFFCEIVSMYALISGGVTLVVTALVIIIAVNVRSSIILTIIIFVFMVIALIIGTVLFIVQISKNDKHIAYRIGVATCFGIAVASAIFMTTNTLHSCVKIRRVDCTIIFRAFCLWVEMIILFTSTYTSTVQ